MGRLVDRESQSLETKHGSGDDFETFEAIEFLVLGIHGKWAVWRALSVVAAYDSRLAGTDFRTLIARAENQHARVERTVLEPVRAALAGKTLVDVMKPLTPEC
jgi:hypothetical protein